MLLIAGTVPIKDMPLTFGPVGLGGDGLVVDGRQIPCTQGTGAMVTAALTTIKHLGLEPPQLLVAGDIGDGQGSRALYEYLSENVANLEPQVLALHYWMPDIGQMMQLCDAVGKMETRPLLIADAGSMYAAKAAGLAKEFDIFTPDAAEAAYLADPYASHPAYVRFLTYNDMERMPELIKAAYQKENAARYLLVKGAVDYIVANGEIVATIDEPDVPMLEPIGGTGDTITGLVAAFVCAGLEPTEAAIMAARSNRMAGKYAEPTPATRVKGIIDHFPAVFRDHLCRWSGVCIR
jgi:NAD(P)H-hydrate repair Nnr-like enzyme with NAD(P)H-hydrate dehydratase domain